MKKLKVSISIRIRQDGKQKYVPPVWLNKKELKQGWAMVQPGKPEHRPEGSYALRYMFQGKQRFEGVGQDAAAALSALKERAWQINNQDMLTSIHDALAAQAGRAANREPEPEAKGKYPLDKAIQIYLRDVAATASKRTVAGYAYTLAEFRKVCKKAYIEDVVKSDLTAFVAAMKAEQITRTVKGVEEKIPRYTDRTIANRVDEVVGLLRDKRESRGAGKGILNVKLPIKYAKKKVVSYKPEQLKRLFEAADQEQRERFLFFLDSGFRDQECQQARWEAVDFEKRSIVLRETDDFTTKDREERHIPLSREVVDMLKARRERYSAAVLIFPAKDGGKPEGHFLRSLKRLRPHWPLKTAPRGAYPPVPPGPPHAHQRLRPSPRAGPGSSFPSVLVARTPRSGTQPHCSQPQV